MRLKKHREDVKWLKTPVTFSWNEQQAMAYRYHRLILFAEDVKPFLTPTVWKTLQRVLKDAEK